MGISSITFHSQSSDWLMFHMILICISIPVSIWIDLSSYLECSQENASSETFLLVNRNLRQRNDERGAILINYWKSFVTKSISKAIMIATFYKPSIVKSAYSNIYWWCHKFHKKLFIHETVFFSSSRSGWRRQKQIFGCKLE